MADENNFLKLFEDKNIRVHWDADEEKWYFSVIDIIYALTDSKDPNDYWYKLKIRVNEESKIELSTICRQLKMLARDGKMRITDSAEIKGILRIIQSVPSPKAEPLKLWLAQIGSERIDETFDPEIAINRALDTYRKKGYSEEWINQRLKINVLDTIYCLKSLILLHIIVFLYSNQQNKRIFAKPFCSCF